MLVMSSVTLRSYLPIHQRLARLRFDLSFNLPILVIGLMVADQIIIRGPKTREFSSLYIISKILSKTDRV